MHDVNLLLVGSSGYLGKNIYKALSGSCAIRCALSRASDIKPHEFIGVDVVVNVAGLAHSSEAGFWDYNLVNSQFPYELASEARHAEVKKFVHISSISVYGSSARHIDESTTEAPDCAYGKSKLEGDRLLISLEQDAFEVVIIRPPMIYGLYAPGNPMRLRNMIEKLRVLPLDGISNRRSFISIDNLIIFIKSAVSNNCRGTFLVSDDDEVATTDFVKYIAKTHKLKLFLFKLPFLRIVLSIILPHIAEKMFGDLTVSNVKAKKLLSIDRLLPFG